MAKSALTARRGPVRRSGSGCRCVRPPLRPPADLTQAPPHEIPAIDAHGLRILIAEDNLVNQRVTVALLKRLGFTGVTVVGNGRAALDAALSNSFDVALLDLQMPEMDGLEAAREIRRQVATERRPRLVALTANALKGDREMCLSKGMDDYLSKPLEIDDLRSALARCVPLSMPARAHLAIR